MSALIPAWRLPSTALTPLQRAGQTLDAARAAYHDALFAHAQAPHGRRLATDHLVRVRSANVAAAFRRYREVAEEAPC